MDIQSKSSPDPDPDPPQLPLELIELIIRHLEYYDLRKYWTSWEDIFISYETLCRLGLVCKKWASISQRSLWDTVYIADNKDLDQIVRSPAFGRHPIRKLIVMGSGVMNETLLEGLAGLQELVFTGDSSEEATWWNSKHLKNLRVLEIHSPLVLPQPSKPYFRLESLLINVHNDAMNLWSVTGIIDCCGSTIEVVVFTQTLHDLFPSLPTWLDRSRLPLLRIVKLNVNDDDILFIRQHEGLTHVYADCDSKYFNIRAINLCEFPSTLQSLEIEIDPFDNWLDMFGNSFGDHRLVPSLRAIQLKIRHDNSEKDNMPSEEELSKVEALRTFWKRRNIFFDVQHLSACNLGP